MHDYRLVYERKCPFSLLITDEEMLEKVGRKEVRETEELIVKILVRGSDELNEVKVELHSQNDYFFEFEHKAD